MGVPRRPVKLIGELTGCMAGIPVVVCSGVCNHEVPRVTSVTLVVDLRIFWGTTSNPLRYQVYYIRVMDIAVLFKTRLQTALSFLSAQIRSAGTPLRACLRGKQGDVSDADGELTANHPCGWTFQCAILDRLFRSLGSCSDVGFVRNLGVLVKLMLAECRHTFPLGEAYSTPCVDHVCGPPNVVS